MTSANYQEFKGNSVMNLPRLLKQMSGLYRAIDGALKKSI